MSDQAPRVTLVIPCRNESARLPSTLAALQAFLSSRPYEMEVLIVVEKSTDGTEHLAQAAAQSDSRIRAICNPIARGKGFAVKTGMLQARGEIVFFTDADLSVPLRFIDEFLPEFSHADVVIGSRRHKESNIPQAQPFRRVFLGRVFNHGLRLLGLTTFKDTQCGFKAFRYAAAKDVFSRLTLDGFTFDVEALALAEVLGYRVVARPVEWSDVTGSKVRALRDGTGGFLQAVLAAWRARRENRS